MFRALPCSSSGGLRRNCIYAASDIVTVCMWLSCAPVKKDFFLYLHIIHLLKSSTCFEHYPAHLQEVYVVIVYMQPLVSSLCRWLSCAPVKKEFFLYLHIIHLLKSSTCFEHYPAHLQEVCVVIVYMQPLVSSLSAGDCLVHRLRKSSFSIYI